MLQNNREGSLKRLATLNRKLKRQMGVTPAYEEIIEEQREQAWWRKQLADGPCVGGREFYIILTTQIGCTSYSRVKIANSLRCICEGFRWCPFSE